ncbi:MAG: 4Fe-4S binding protein [Marinilabiliales bacterium]|nr:4Fe-4S binding protein [Marinilabiliales bacterium]
MMVSDAQKGLGGDPGLTGKVFDVKRYAINDGPGIRITIFLKGCNLNCAWCHNPEGISLPAERMYARSACIGCGLCLEACSNGALSLTREGIAIQPERCDRSGHCAEVCPTRATEMSGREIRRVT